MLAAAHDSRSNNVFTIYALSVSFALFAEAIPPTPLLRVPICSLPCNILTQVSPPGLPRQSLLSLHILRIQDI